MHKIKIFLSKLLITIIITLIMLILMKSNISFKNNFYRYVYNTNFSFTKVSNLYNKYFSNIIEIPTFNEKTVFNEKISYQQKESYNEGVKLKVDNNYSIPNQESGIVVFIGTKDNYGNVIIIEQTNGIDVWYGNINNVNVKLYDYIEKGKIIGEADNYLYLVFKKDGKILNYEDYI